MFDKFLTKEMLENELQQAETARRCAEKAWHETGDYVFLEDASICQKKVNELRHALNQ